MSNGEINIAPFYAGQKVVALKSSTNPLTPRLVKGETYTVEECRWHSCCNNWWVYIRELSINPSGFDIQCCKANKLSFLPFACGEAKYFAPIQENFQSISLEKVLEKETPLISVN